LQQTDSRIGNRQRLINPGGFDKAREAAPGGIGNAGDMPLAEFIFATSPPADCRSCPDKKKPGQTAGLFEPWQKPSCR
jgi:hypothetical protein